MVGAKDIFPPGVHEVREIIRVPSNTHVDLTGRTFVFPPNVQLFTQFLIEGVENVTITGGTFDGNIHAHARWEETCHAIAVHDARNVTIANVQFVRTNGDCILLYRVPGGPGCANVKILDCEMSGEGENRNGISIVHAQDVEIAGNLLRGMSRPDMPGAIDLEPNFSDEQCGNIWIHHNRIEYGNAHGIQLWNGAAHTGWIDRIVIEENTIIGHRPRGIWLCGSPNADEGSVRVSGNTIKDARRAIVVENMGANVYGNSISGEKREKTRRRPRRQAALENDDD